MFGVTVRGSLRRYMLSCALMVYMHGVRVDLNPIENIFNITKQALARTAVRDHIERETEAQFAERVQRTLRDVAIMHANRCIESMPKRVQLIANGNGYRSRY